MAQLVSAMYDIEQFQYFQERRQRPKMVFAVLGPNDVRGAIHQWNYTHTPGTKSLSRYSTVSADYDDRATDCFLSSFDDGHLIGDQLGGSRQPYNLVPQVSEKNRGGTWKAFETAAVNSAYCLYVVACEYNDREDSRIPSKIYGVCTPIVQRDFLNLARRIDVFRNLMAPGAWHRVQDVKQRIRVELLTGPYLTARPARIQIVEVEMEQNGLHIRPPGWSLDVQRLEHLLQQTWLDMDPNWRIEEEQRFDLHESGIFYGFDYELPPVDHRPYRVLDYLALNGRLNDIVQNPSTNAFVSFDVNRMSQATSFSQGAKSLIMATNRILHRLSIGANIGLYYSDASDDTAGLGERLVTNPEIDYIIPKTPPDATRKPGSSIFSNAWLVSNVYNSRAGGSRFTLQQTIQIGKAIPLFLQRSRPSRRGRPRAQ